HVEVEEPEGTGVCADLVGHPGNIDDPNVKALLLERERISHKALIDGVDRSIANRLDIRRKRISSREEADRWERFVNDGADPKIEGGGGDSMIGGNDSIGRGQRIVEQIRIVGIKALQVVEANQAHQRRVFRRRIERECSGEIAEWTRKVDDMTQHPFDLALQRFWEQVDRRLHVRWNETE